MNNLNVNWAPGISLESMEKACILSAYKFYRGNAAQTAISLGVSERTIRDKLKKYEQDGQIEREKYEQRKLDNAATLDRMRGKVGTPLEAHQQSLYRADAGLHMEPTFKAPEEPVVSVSESKEVQVVLPQNIAANNQRRRR